MSMKAEWKRASAFAEFAEAVGVATSEVIAAWSVLDAGEPTGVIAVLYGTDVICEARLYRTADGILRVAGKPEETDLRPEDFFGVRP